MARGDFHLHFFCDENYLTSTRSEKENAPPSQTVVPPRFLPPFPAAVLELLCMMKEPVSVFIRSRYRPAFYGLYRLTVFHRIIIH